MTNRRQFFNIPTAGLSLPKLPDQPGPVAQFNSGPVDVEQLSIETNAAIISQTTRKPLYDQKQVSIPAGTAIPVNLSVIPDRVYFYTTAAFALPLLIGPDSGFLSLPAGAYICLPGTSKIYWISNPNTAAVIVTIISIRDLPEFEIGAVASGAGAPGALTQKVSLSRLSDGLVLDEITTAPALTLGAASLQALAAFIGGMTGTATAEGYRIPKVFKMLSALLVTAETTIWTPAAGKKFRLMGFMIGQGVLAGTITLRDNTAGPTILIIPQHTVGQTMPYATFGNGILSAAANNVLTAQGAATETLTGYVFGTEE